MSKEMEEKVGIDSKIPIIISSSDYTVTVRS